MLSRGYDANVQMPYVSGSHCIGHSELHLYSYNNNGVLHRVHRLSVPIQFWHGDWHGPHCFRAVLFVYEPAGQ